MAEEGCGTHCGRCRPYLERMLATGETVLPVLRTLDA
jgi:bacterioferritin-associated ferredoxin